MQASMLVSHIMKSKLQLQLQLHANTALNYVEGSMKGASI